MWRRALKFTVHAMPGRVQEGRVHGMGDYSAATLAPAFPSFAMLAVSVAQTAPVPCHPRTYHASACRLPRQFPPSVATCSSLWRIPSPVCSAGLHTRS